MVAPGLPALDKTLVDIILMNQFVDLTDVPPAKGRSPGTNKLLEGHLILVQPMDLLQTKRLIPDFPTWLQCYSVYTAVLLTQFPQRATSLLLYQKNMAYLSQRFKWPSWVVYDNTFRQEAADTKKLDWSQIDYGIHARCFHNQTSSVEAWCSSCHSVDHLQDNCQKTAIRLSTRLSTQQIQTIYPSHMPELQQRGRTLQI